MTGKVVIHDHYAVGTDPGVADPVLLLTRLEDWGAASNGT